MTKDDLKRAGFIETTRGWTKPPADSRQVPDAKPERDKAPTLDRAVPREGKGVERIRVRFIGYRARPLDPDNFAGSIKNLLDGLRASKLIPDDSPEFITLETEQVKVKSYKEECTVIEIWKP